MAPDGFKFEAQVGVGLNQSRRLEEFGLEIGFGSLGLIKARVAVSAVAEKVWGQNLSSLQLQLEGACRGKGLEELELDLGRVEVEDSW